VLRVFDNIEVHSMTALPIRIYGLGGTIATVPGAVGMKVGLGADDLVRAVPQLASVAPVDAVTVSRIASSDLAVPDILRLAARIADDAATAAIAGAVVTQGTDTLEETAFLLDCVLELDIPVIVIGAMRNPAMASADGAGNLLAAVRVAASELVRSRARELGVLSSMLDDIHAAVDIEKSDATRIDAFASRRTGPIGVVVEDRVHIDAFPVRPHAGLLRRASPELALQQMAGRDIAVALLPISMGESGGLMRAMIAAPDGLGYGGAVLAGTGGGHVSTHLADTVVALAARMPVVMTSRAGGTSLLHKTYEHTGGEIDLRRRGVLWSRRLSPLKARLLLDLLLRADVARPAIADCFERLVHA